MHRSRRVIQEAHISVSEKKDPLKLHEAGDIGPTEFLKFEETCFSPGESPRTSTTVKLSNRIIKISFFPIYESIIFKLALWANARHFDENI